MKMLFLFFFFIVNTCKTQSNTGTTLFFNKRLETGCWNEEDLAKLRARMVFHQLLPSQTTPDSVNKKFINDAIRYYRKALHTVDKQECSHTRSVLKETLIDTVGGHLRSDVLPTARFAYYAGYVPYKPVRELHEFYDELKMILNTQGQGWRRPTRTPKLGNLTVVKIMIGPGKLFNPCDCLVLQRDTNACIRLPTPKVDDGNIPSAIALPFKHGGLFNLFSPKSENILLKYYTTAARCILSNSPESCRHADFVIFNNDLWHWMKRDVAPYLMDEKLYTAYGGVFRIAAAVQNYGRGLSRRNLFDFYPPTDVNKWHPWKTLKESYISVNADWSPGLCVLFVVLAAVLICLLQVMFKYLCGNKNGCQCAGPKTSEGNKLSYTKIDPNLPAMLPGSNLHDNKLKESGPVTLHRKDSSVGTGKTQRVYYDFHENCDQFMDVVMSEAEGDSNTSTDSGAESNENDDDNEEDKITRPNSPPEIESSIAELKINKSRQWSRRYSPSRREGAGAGAGGSAGAGSAEEQWAWSESGESSTSSADTQPRSRDLAWARRKLDHSRTKTTSGTEFDHNSYTTPTSHRYS